MSGIAADGVAPPRNAPSRARMSRKRLVLAGAGLAALIAAAAATHHVTVGQYFETTDDAYVGGDVSDLAPQVSGLVAAVAVSDNQSVHAGDLLVKLDDRTFRLAVEKSQAAVAGAQANLANLAATRRLQLALIDEADADVAAAQAQTELALANQSRYDRLAATQAGSVQAAQTATTAFRQATATATRAQAASTAARAQLAVIDTQRQQVVAALAGAQADLAAAQLNLGYSKIRAPFDGVIGNRAAHVGGYAAAGAQLLSIVPARGLWVDANFKEDQLSGIRPGEAVNITADILPGARITGHVASVAPASGAVFSVLPAENATGNFTKIVQRVPVRILLDGTVGALGVLRPGLSVTASVDTRAP